ncbi:MAG: ROK family protein, partial [Pseudomonadota bacterium]
VGGGLVADGRLIGGANGIAGEWGHAPLPDPRRDETPGPLCWCGRRGCIETWCSGPALAADHLRASGETLTAARIAERAEAGDAAAAATLERHAVRLGRALAMAVNVFDPEAIVLGGGLSNLNGVAERARRAMLPHVFSDNVVTRIVVNRHGDSSGVRGAARLWPLEGE